MPYLPFVCILILAQHQQEIKRPEFKKEASAWAPQNRAKPCSDSEGPPTTHLLTRRVKAEKCVEQKWKSK